MRMKFPRLSLRKEPKTTTPSIKQRLLAELRKTPRVNITHTTDPNGNELVIYNIDVKDVPPEKLVEIMTAWTMKLRAMEGRRRIEVQIDTEAESRVYNFNE